MAQGLRRIGGVLLGAASAAGSLALASMGRERELLDSSTGRADMEPTGGEAQERLGGGD
jgi:hypothetical protein